MKLLFDENLSPKLAQMFAELFPGSQHVDAAGLRGERDETIWAYAKTRQFVIVSKDNDFRRTPTQGDLALGR